jgi:endonuclease/exonuclease/phosphatase family metal-dependent hydrolase
MKITTLNLQGFVDWHTRQSEILAYLKATNPDVILFQEVVFIPDISPFNQVQLLNQELQYPYEHSAVTRLQPSSEHKTFREGLAMLSKYPVVKTDTVVLKKEVNDEHHRIIQLVDLIVDHHAVLLANVHFSLTDTTDFATAHLEETLQIIADKDEERIIAGDFNIDHLETLSGIWSEHYEASTKVPYISYPAMHKRNDYVLVPKPLKFTEIATSGDTLSDHRAVTVNIAILDR